MNTAATAWYNAVPSMLTVVPSGSTKLAILFGTPKRFSQTSIVTGSVAADELVENATAITCL